MSCFNREYQKRATRQGLAERRGGQQMAADAALRLPWAGIFEVWRPFVLTAVAAKFAGGTPALPKRCKKSSQRLLFDGKLRGVQLALSFPDPVQNTSKSPADSEFPALAAMVDPMAQDILTEEALAAEFEKLFS